MVAPAVSGGLYGSAVIALPFRSWMTAPLALVSCTDWSALLGIREEVMKALDTARNEKMIGKPLEAQLTITAANPAYSLLARYKEQLRYLFIVSAVQLLQGSGNGTGSVHIEVKKADGAKCERCWNYSTHVGEDKNYPTVCERCSTVLKELEA